MTTPKKKSSKAKNTTKKSTSTVETKLEPVETNNRDKTAFMVLMLSRPEGVTLKEIAEALGWKENSIRGAMSVYAKKTGGTISSEKKDKARYYHLKKNGD